MATQTAPADLLTGYKIASAIQMVGLTKFYGSNRGVIDLDLTVKEGEIFGFLGPNGAGKTTTIRLLMDLIRPTRGKARIFGLDSRADSVAIKQLIGYLPGELVMWPNLTGWQILTYLGNLRGGIDPKHIESLAERLDLDLRRKFREYSKGNKQKVCLVQAFMHNPRLLILDEPTASLDPLNQQEFFSMISEACARGATVFLSSHILSAVEQICNRVGIIREGRLVRVGPISSLAAEKHYHVSLSLVVPAEGEVAAAFARLPEVTNIEASGNMLHFVVHGTLDTVIKLAALYPVLSLTSHEPTLEETFLEYYGPNTSATTPPPAQKAPEVSEENHVHAA